MLTGQSPVYWTHSELGSLKNLLTVLPPHDPENWDPRVLFQAVVKYEDTQSLKYIPKL